MILEKLYLGTQKTSFCLLILFICRRKQEPILKHNGFKQSRSTDKVQKNNLIFSITPSTENLNLKLQYQVNVNTTCAFLNFWMEIQDAYDIHGLPFWYLQHLTKSTYQKMKFNFAIH
jgi:hypothetical protein